MEKVINLKMPTTITFVNELSPSEGLNDTLISLHKEIGFERKSLHAYIVDAKRILNKESKSLNPLGIQRLLAALIIEVIGNENYGDQN